MSKRIKVKRAVRGGAIYPHTLYPNKSYVVPDELVEALKSVIIEVKDVKPKPVKNAAQTYSVSKTNKSAQSDNS